MSWWSSTPAFRGAVSSRARKHHAPRLFVLLLTSAPPGPPNLRCGSQFFQSVPARLLIATARMASHSSYFNGFLCRRSQRPLRARGFKKPLLRARQSKAARKAPRPCPRSSFCLAMILRRPFPRRDWCLSLSDGAFRLLYSWTSLIPNPPKFELVVLRDSLLIRAAISFSARL